MLHFKQTLHKTYMQILETISTIKTESKSLGVVPQNLVLVENVGKMLLSLVWLLNITVLLTVTCILSLLSLLKLILMKSKELLVIIRMPGYNVQYILCRWVDAVKSIPLTLKTWQKHVWQKDGDSHQDYTFHSSEMRGELNNLETGEDMLLAQRDKYKEQNKKYKIIDEDKIRKAGW